jgi:hypothetical protein
MRHLVKAPFDIASPTSLRVALYLSIFTLWSQKRPMEAKNAVSLNERFLVWFW